MDSSKYSQEMHSFIKEFDPKLTNENYYKGLFYQNFSPETYLNMENDPQAKTIKADYDKLLSIGGSPAGRLTTVLEELSKDQ